MGNSGGGGGGDDSRNSGNEFVRILVMITTVTIRMVMNCECGDCCSGDAETVDILDEMKKGMIIVLRK